MHTVPPGSIAVIPFLYQLQRTVVVQGSCRPGMADLDAPASTPGCLSPWGMTPPLFSILHACQARTYMRTIQYSPERTGPAQNGLRGDASLS
jgi:hypothetical protein